MLDASNVPARALVGAVALGIVHKRRLREVYRSAGWPCQDGIEVELLEPAYGVAPGQAVVIYDGTRVVGSATIAAAGRRTRTASRGRS